MPPFLRLFLFFLFLLQGSAFIMRIVNIASDDGAPFRATLNDYQFKFQVGGLAACTSRNLLQPSLAPSRDDLP